MNIFKVSVPAQVNRLKGKAVIKIKNIITDTTETLHKGVTDD